MKSIMEIFGIAWFFPLIYGLVIWISERRHESLGRASLILGVISWIVSCHQLLRYLSWAWVASKPPDSSGFYGWLVNRSDLLWFALLVGLLVVGVTRGREYGVVPICKPVVIIVFGIGFMLGSLLLGTVLVVTTLVS